MVISLTVLLSVVFSTSAFSFQPAPVSRAPASGQHGAKHCSIAKWLPEGMELVIADAATGKILYRIHNRYPSLLVNGTAYDGRYHRFAIGSSIFITRPFFSTGFNVSVSCAYGISDPE